jgi:hypothetical protein
LIISLNYSFTCVDGRRRHVNFWHVISFGAKLDLHPTPCMKRFYCYVWETAATEPTGRVRTRKGGFMPCPSPTRTS